MEFYHNNMNNSIEKAALDDEKIHFPRTGKRGVPQQFPRKLYEMIEFESGSFSVEWVASGRGFRITNVEHFSEVVLPKWFKTSKLSSFQRNLNLYGFSKQRKGANTTYYHPHFFRGNINGLSNIRKRGSGNKKRGTVDNIMHHRSVSTTGTHVQMKPADVSQKLHWSPNSGRLGILTEVMRLVIEEEMRSAKMYIPNAQAASSVQTYFYS